MARRYIRKELAEPRFLIQVVFPKDSINLLKILALTVKPPDLVEEVDNSLVWSVTYMNQAFATKALRRIQNLKASFDIQVSMTRQNGLGESLPNPQRSHHELTP